MNGVYFFIPFILVVSLGLSDEFVPEVHSIGSIEKGIDYDRELIEVKDDGTKIYRWTSTPEKIKTNFGDYVEYIHSETANSIIIETMQASVTLDKNTCGFSFHDKGLIDNSPVPFHTDSIVPYSKTPLGNWSVVNQVNDATCQASWNGSELTATKHSPGVGTISYKYILNNGTWKTLLEATNLTSLTDRIFGFDQTINLNTDVIHFGGSNKNLDNYDNTTFDRTWLENNQKNVVEFLEGYYFDFNDAFDYLDSITVIDSGPNSSQLVFHYMRNGDVLLPNDTLIIDPTYGPTSDSDAEVLFTGLAAAGTCATFTSNATITTTTIGTGASAASSRCWRAVAEWNVDSIIAAEPDSIDSANFIVNLSTDTNMDNCDMYYFDDGLGNLSITQKADRAAGTGSTTILTDDTFCGAIGTDVSVSLPAIALSSITTTINNGDSDVGLGIRGGNDPTRDAVQRTINFNDLRLQIEYTTLPRPDAVDDLALVSESFGTVVLSWTEPNLNTGNLSGYQINYSTPFGNPLTVITNDTGTSTTQTTITGLELGTDYTFGVSAWVEGGNNATHPPMSWLNVTTGGNFTIGSAVFNQTNNEVLPITFETQSINDTAIFLNVTFSNAFDLACDFNYKYAINNQTYKDLDSYAVSTSLNETSFIFNNVTNEVIGVDCWDYNTGTDADYVITISDFPLLQQITDFRNGEFGTMGKIGVFDVVTLFVVIISMIGLNRVNESVGIIFNVALLGSLAWFEIIELPTVLFGVLALVMVFVITSTRKG